MWYSYTQAAQKSQCPRATQADLDAVLLLVSALVGRFKFVVCLIDCPDPDNVVLALVAAAEARRKGASCRIVLTGRPIDLGVRQLRPAEVGARLKAGDIPGGIAGLLVRTSSEVSVDQHSRAVLLDSASRFERALRLHGFELGEGLRLCDGGVAPSDPVAENMHAKEYCFDRADLLEEYGVAGVSDGVGEDVEGAASGVLPGVKAYWALWDAIERAAAATSGGETAGDETAAGGEALAREVLQRLRAPQSPLTSLEELAEELASGGCCSVRLLVGGPLTALNQLLSLKPAVAAKVTGANMMMCAWDAGLPESKNIFKNQFNVGTDLEAARSLLEAHEGNPLWSNRVPVTLITTETCKAPALTLTAEALRERLAPAIRHGGVNAEYMLQLYALWQGINGGRPFQIFDVACALADDESRRDTFSYRPAVARFDVEEGVLRLHEGAEEDWLRATDRALPAGGEEAYYAALNEYFSLLAGS